MIRESILLLLGVLSTQASADVRLHGLFSDGVVLQRDTKLPVWGTADAGESVTVTLAGKKASSQADFSGHWRVDLDPVKAGGPFVLEVAGHNSLRVENILIGDVWLCSGQSNMAYPMSALQPTVYAPDLKQADFPQIRHAMIPRTPASTPAADVQVQWQICSPETVPEFTAVGYYLARELHRELKVPIGIINSSWGGTAAEAWTSAAALGKVPAFAERLTQQTSNFEALPQLRAEFPTKIRAWEEANGRVDAGNLGEQHGWANPSQDTSDWKPIRLRQKWREAGFQHGGVVWLRKEIDLPPEAQGRDFRLDLGSIDDMYEVTYFNGEKLGESGREPPEFYNRYRNYKVPARLVKQGRNVLAIRLTTPDAAGSALSRDAMNLGFRELGVDVTDQNVLMKIEQQFAPLDKESSAARPKTPKGNIQNVSSFLYNGMIHPLAPFAIKGVVWYQGEADANREFAYRTQLPLLIEDWRSLWGRELPFLVQQLPNWKSSSATSTEWAELREAQDVTGKRVPGVFVSCASDLGESSDVHPIHKRDVGVRLAKVALKDVYGMPVVSTGPAFQGFRVDGSRIRIKLSHNGALTTRDGKPPASLMIAGDDRTFFAAEASIEGEELVVTHPQVSQPVAVRYAFINDPIEANVTDASGLPALPFRTDEWPTATQSRP